MTIKGIIYNGIIRQNYIVMHDDVIISKLEIDFIKNWNKQKDLELAFGPGTVSTFGYSVTLTSNVINSGTTYIRYANKS